MLSNIIYGAFKGTDHAREWITTISSARASRIIFLRWQISRRRKKKRVAWTSTSYEKHKGGGGLGRAKRRSVHASRAEVRKTTTGLFFLHPVWITIIPPSIVYCGGELFYYRSVGRTRILSERACVKETGTGGRCRRERGYTRKNDCAAPGGSTIYWSHERKPRGYEKPTVKNQSWFVGKKSISSIILQ